MPPRLRGKWALGITPRNFTWFMKDKLAVCERPGGYGDNHRRVRRQEEIIWLRENGFGCVISIIPAPHNLHNYDELGVVWRHRPVPDDELSVYELGFFSELRDMLQRGERVCSFTGLGDGDHQRIGQGNAFAVTILAGNFNRSWKRSNGFQPISSH